MRDGAVHLDGHYFDLLRRIHVAMRPRTYVEIGVHTGGSLALASPATTILGIDPVPAIRMPINRTARLFFETSDDFFAQHDVNALLGGRTVDMAFIDGMHLFEFALRDFRNVERHCGPGSIVFVHDCYPLDEESSQRVRYSDTWTGDTWKLVPCLRELRPDLHIATIAVRPTGLTVIRNLDPTNTVLDDRYDEALARFSGITFQSIVDRRDDVLHVVPNRWEQVAALLPSEPFAAVGASEAARHSARSVRATPRASARILRAGRGGCRRSSTTAPDPDAFGRAAASRRATPTTSTPRDATGSADRLLSAAR
jgi:hypothetical protein